MKPTVLPASVGRRGARWPDWLASPAVGSRTRKVMGSSLLLGLLLGGLAGEAGADGRGEGAAGVAEPRGDARAEAARRSAGGNHQQMVDRLERRIDLVGLVADDRA